jgi:transposase-like protein
MSIETNPVFQDATKARECLERLLWPDGPVCPHCGLVNCSKQLHGTAHRAGVYKCKGCDKQYTVTVGTIFESSHLPLNKWLFAFHLMVSSKKGMSAHQLHRMLKVTYKTAWFMAHRIREALRERFPEGLTPLGGQGKTAEADESYIGGKDKNRHANKRKGFHGTQGKEPVFSLVERNGKVRSFHLPDVKGDTLRGIVKAHLDGKTVVYTDNNHTTQFAVKGFEGGAVNHSLGEYVRGDAHTNTIENYFSILKRGIIGTYHHVSQQHLKRYLAEFDFRHNERMALGVDDSERATKALKGIVGKRLTYRRTDNAEAAS